MIQIIVERRRDGLASRYRDCRVARGQLVAPDIARGHVANEAIVLPVLGLTNGSPGWFTLNNWERVVGGGRVGKQEDSGEILHRNCDLYENLKIWRWSPSCERARFNVLMRLQILRLCGSTRQLIDENVDEDLALVPWRCDRALYSLYLASRSWLVPMSLQLTGDRCPEPWAAI